MLLNHCCQVLVEPGTPEGSNIITQMRSHILWMEQRVSHFVLCRKLKANVLSMNTFMYFLKVKNWLALFLLFVA